MLRHSRRLLFRSQKSVHMRAVSNKVDNDVKLGAEAKKSHELIKERVVNMSSSAYSKYAEIIGWNEIEEAYRKVTALQENLHSLQSERTLLQLQISNVRGDLSILQQELHDHKRGDHKYLELIKREFEITQKKTKLEDQYTIMDKKEREMFSHLQAQINMLHEKSRTHTRQWGIISTVVGALLGMLGMSISAYYRNKEFRNIQQGIQMQFQVQIEQITKDTQQIIQGYSKLMSFIENQELTMRQQHHRFQQQEKPNTIALRNSESWAGYLKRKTIFVWKFCTFQKTM